MNRLCQVSPLALVLSLWSCLPVPLHAVSAAAAPPSAQAQDSGRISGVAIDERGQPLPRATVRVEREMAVGRRRDLTRQILGTTTTDAEGRFSFTELPPSHYVVALLRGVEITASIAVDVTADTMDVSGVVLAEGAAARQEVRVTLTGGDQRTGRLLLLTTSEVVIRANHGDEHIPLGHVRSVEAVHHRIRNASILGSLIGIAAAVPLSCGGDEGVCDLPVAVLIGAPIGAGVGTLVGWLRSRGGSKVLYAAPSITGVTVTPLRSTHGIGVGVSVEW